MKPNPVKKLLARGQPTCGSWVSLCSPLGAEVMALAGFDWLLIDMEHGAGDYQTLLHQLQAVAAAGETVPIVRVQWNDPVVIKRVLDLGAAGVMVPGIATVDDARRAVGAIKYPPEGFRGIAGVRASRFGQDPDYLEQANDNIMMFLQFETVEAVENAGAILDVPGIDVAFIGPNDLAAAMGHRGDLFNPAVQAAIKQVEDAADARNIPLGSVSRNWEQAKALFDKHYRAVSIMGDIPFLLSAAKAGVASFRAHPHAAGR